jgi:hypothetical protein
MSITLHQSPLPLYITYIKQRVHTIKPHIIQLSPIPLYVILHLNKQFIPLSPTHCTAISALPICHLTSQHTIYTPLHNINLPVLHSYQYTHSSQCFKFSKCLTFKLAIISPGTQNELFRNR